MKRFLPLFIFMMCSGMGKLSAQCELSITASDTLVCSGDGVTLTATATPALNLFTLNSTLAGGNNHRGNMFDISATNTVTITSFDAHPMGNTTIEIYYRPTPYAGFTSSAAGWTLIGSAAVTAQPFGTPTPVPVPVNVVIPAGQTYSFYVTSNSTGVSLNYTDGSVEGAPYTSDANIVFRQGVGMEYPFTNGTGSVFTPRVWNGVIHYGVPVAGTTTYAWSTLETTPSINPTVSSATQYNVQVDITGCPTLYDSINIQVSTPPVFAGNDTAICAGSSVTLSGSGAVSYSWNNGITNGLAFTPSADSNYVVTGTDTIGCTASDSVMVMVNALPDVFAGNDTALCTGAEMILSGSGAVSYNWDNGVADGIAFTPAATLSYIVSGTDVNNCSNNDTVTVVVNDLPTVDLGPDKILCNNATDLLDAGSGFSQYAWSNSTTNQTLNIDGAVLGTGNFSFSVTVTDANGCQDSDTTGVTVIDCLGLDPAAEINMNVYPNPAHDVLIIQFENTQEMKVSIDILNEIGQLIMQGTTQTYSAGNQIKTLDISGFAPGIYFIQMKLNGKLIAQKLIVQ